MNLSMKIRALIFILLISIGYHANAQTLSEPMETAVEICKNLSNAIRTSSTAALKAENNRLKTAGIIECEKKVNTKLIRR